MKLKWHGKTGQHMPRSKMSPHQLKIVREKDREHYTSSPSKKRSIDAWRHNNPENIRIYRRNRRKKNVKFVWHYKQRKGCADCSEHNPIVLDFHHRNPTNKKYNIGSQLTSISWQQLKKEIAKCVVLCSNCHRRREWHKHHKKGWKP